MSYPQFLFFHHLENFTIIHKGGFNMDNLNRCISPFVFKGINFCHKCQRPNCINLITVYEKTIPLSDLLCCGNNMDILAKKAVIEKAVCKFCHAEYIPIWEGTSIIGFAYRALTNNFMLSRLHDFTIKEIDEK